MSRTADDEHRAVVTTVPSSRRHRFHAFRTRVRGQPGWDLAYRCTVAVAGSVVLAAGILMIPYPGPGWLVVFAGLAILSTEFTWARRLLHYGRRQYDRWNAWQHRQPPMVRLALFAATAAVVILTLWLLDMGGFLADWTGLSADWLHSPLGSFA